MEMNTWKFMIGSAILSGGLLLKAGAPAFAVVLGVVLAALVTWKTERRTTRVPR
jgi:hypothetical protein